MSKDILSSEMNVLSDEPVAESSTSNQISIYNTVVTLPTDLEKVLLPVEINNSEESSKKLFRTYSKQLVLKNKNNKYRLIRKSPLKGSPVKSLTHILRKHRRSKSKGISPRKLKFILPKITKFSPRKVKQPRLLKSKSTPPLHNNLFQAQLSYNGDTCKSNQMVCDLQDGLMNSEIEEAGKADEAHDENIGSKDADFSSHVAEDNEEDDMEDTNQQEKEYLAAFLKASSTIAFQKCSERKAVTSCEQKLSKQQRRLHDRILALSYVPDLKTHQDALVLSFLLEVKDALSNEEDEAKFEEFLCSLEHFSNSSSDTIELYYKIIDILKGFPDLQEAFLMFLKPEQAAKVGKYKEYLNIECIRTFAEELKHQSSKQPQNLQKVLRSLDSVLSVTDGESVVASLTPVLKLQPWLLESLSKCIPDAKPQYSLADDFEEIDLDRPCSPSGFEHIILSEEDGKGGGVNNEKCFCFCHSSEHTTVLNASLGQSFKSEHCLSCALRFMDGRVFLQCGRTLRLAKVFYQIKEENLTSSNLQKGKMDPKKDWKHPPKLSKGLQRSFEAQIESDKAAVKRGRKSKKS